MQGVAPAVQFPGDCSRSKRRAHNARAKRLGCSFGDIEVTCRVSNIMQQEHSAAAAADGGKGKRAWVCSRAHTHTVSVSVLGATGETCRRIDIAGLMQRGRHSMGKRGRKPCRRPRPPSPHYFFAGEFLGHNTFNFHALGCIVAQHLSGALLYAFGVEGVSQ